MSDDIPAAIPAPPPRTGRAAAFVAAVAAVALAGGGWLVATAGSGDVALIRVTKHSLLPESLIGTPDYFLSVGTLDKRTLEIDGYTDQPIGNGLDFKLAKPLPLESIAHVELMDEDLARDDIRDRVDVRERVCRGQDYQFELIGPPPPRRTAGYAALAAGGASALLTAILLVRAHAV